MQGGFSSRSTYRRKFFRRELEETIEIDNLLLEAYILVKRAGFTYMDVRGMTRTERTVFMKLLKDDLEREQDAVK
jgi:hypothetical protein